MMDIVPELIDGAIVMTLVNGCDNRVGSCECCSQIVLSMHNWQRYTGVPYIILDLMDENEICEGFLEELLFIRKRATGPFLLVGVMEKPQQILDLNVFHPDFPIFITPEDAVKALRMTNPGLTERSLMMPIQFGTSVVSLWHQIQAETFGAV